MKKLCLILAIALAVTAIAVLRSDPVPIEQKLISIQARDRLADFPAIEQQPVEVQALLLDFADDELLLLKARAAFLRYPDMAGNILARYGSEPEFREILRAHGEHILPPIQHFLDHPVGTVKLMHKAASGYDWLSQVLTDWQAAEGPESGTDGSERSQAHPSALPEAPDSTRATDETVSTRANGDLTPEARGWYAVNFIRQEGYDFLGQFIVDANGEVKWVRTERFLEGVNQFFASGIRNLEVAYRSGEDVSVGDVGWASVDVLIFASAVKVLRAGRAVATSTRGAGVSTRSAALAARITGSGRLVLRSARYAKWPAIIGAGYLVIAHPGLISDLLADVAEVLGYPAWLVQFLGWALILIPVLYIGSWLIRWLLRPAIILLGWLLAILSRFAGGSTSADATTSTARWR